MQPTESNQHTAVNSRQTLQGTDMDIKELATLTAADMDDIYLRNVPAIVLEQYATRLIAAYTEGQEPISLYPCGFKELRRLVIKNGAYLAQGMCEGEPVTESIRSAAMVLIGYAKDMSILLAKQPLYAAPPEPAPQQEPLHVGDSQFESWFSTYWSASLRNGSKQIARDAYAAGMGDPLVSPARAAPSSEEVQRMIGWLRVELGHLVTCQQAADLIERLAAERDMWRETDLRDAARVDELAAEVKRLAARVPDDRIATLEQQNAELVAALELIYSGSTPAKFIARLALAKVKQP